MSQEFHPSKLGPHAELTAICRHLSSKIKWDIILFLFCAKSATEADIMQNLSLPKPAASEALRSLVDVRLLSRYEWKSTDRYKLNQATWTFIYALLNRCSYGRFR